MPEPRMTALQLGHGQLHSGVLYPQLAVSWSDVQEDQMQIAALENGSAGEDPASSQSVCCHLGEQPWAGALLILSPHAAMQATQQPGCCLCLV